MSDAMQNTLGILAILLLIFGGALVELIMWGLGL